MCVREIESLAACCVWSLKGERGKIDAARESRFGSGWLAVLSPPPPNPNRVKDELR